MPNIHIRNNYQKAVVCMVLAYISIALMGVFVKYASDELPSSEILFSRFFIGFVFLLPFLIKDGDFKVDMSQWKFLVLRNLAGIASMFTIQILINIGMCVGVMPVIGLTLPFFSYGGSSLVTMFLSLGIVAGFVLRQRPAWLRSSDE